MKLINSTNFADVLESESGANYLYIYICVNKAEAK